MARNLSGAVVVITGASSGIGRAAALAFAEKGARLVVAARRDEALQDTADACRRLGADAIAVPTDVTDEAAVEALARRAEERFGGIDVWINNAMATVYGRVVDVAPEEFAAITLTQPEKAAEIIHRGVEQGKARILVGPDAYMFDVLARVAPTHYYDVLGRLQSVLRKRAESD